MRIQEKLFTNSRRSNKPELLQAIHQRELSIAIYQRDLQQLESDLSAATEREVNFEASGKTDEIASVLNSFFTENLPQCRAPLNDIAWVLTQFHTVANASSYRLLFSTVSSNMCRKFHTDINDLRLLCTYAGPGTLWVAEDENNRDYDEEHIGEVRIHQADTGDILILKGALYPKGKPVVHGSPTIEETDGKRLCERLLLRLDTNSFLDFQGGKNISL